MFNASRRVDSFLAKSGKLRKIILRSAAFSNWTIAKFVNQFVISGAP
jgi:hypothetical protein